jgi:hypothetical protein
MELVKEVSHDFTWKKGKDKRLKAVESVTAHYWNGYFQKLYVSFSGESEIKIDEFDQLLDLYLIIGELIGVTDPNAKPRACLKETQTEEKEAKEESSTRRIEL